MFTNPDNAFRDYDGFQLIGAKRYSNNWQANVSYTWSHARGTVDNRGGTNAGAARTRAWARPADSQTPITPSTSREMPVRLPRTRSSSKEHTAFLHSAGSTSVYRLPVTTGLAWGRVATIRSLTQGSESVRIEPIGTRRADP